MNRDKLSDEESLPKVALNQVEHRDSSLRSE